MLDGKDHFIHGMKLGIVSLYLVDRAATDSIELKASRNGEERNPLVKGPRFLLQTLPKVLG